MPLPFQLQSNRLQQKARAYHPGFLYFWNGGKVRRYETYLHFFLGKSDEKNIAELIASRPNAFTTIYR
jgi:hypothetical protein